MVCRMPNGKLIKPRRRFSSANAAITTGLSLLRDRLARQRFAWCRTISQTVELLRGPKGRIDHKPDRTLFDRRESSVRDQRMQLASTVAAKVQQERIEAVSTGSDQLEPRRRTRRPA